MPTPVIREQDIIKAGELQKQSRFLGVWRSRHVVLTPLFLLTYEYPGQEMAGIAPTEFLILKQCATVRSAEDETGKPYSFKVESAQRTFILIAPSREDKEAWIGAIAKAMVSKSSAMIPD